MKTECSDCWKEVEHADSFKIDYADLTPSGDIEAFGKTFCISCYKKRTHYLVQQGIEISY